MQFLSLSRVVDGQVTRMVEPGQRLGLSAEPFGKSYPRANIRRVDIGAAGGRGISGGYWEDPN